MVGSSCCLIVGTIHGADGISGGGQQTSDSRRDGTVLFQFSRFADPNAWKIRDDVVMGGRSQGSFHIDAEGKGVFSGTVSLENDGGFSSVRHDFSPIDVSAYSTAVIRLKGDGRRYQFRVASNPQERHSYVYPFETDGEWQTVEIPLAAMYPQFHGRRLELPCYPVLTMSQVRFLIANGVAESFRLEIESIRLR